mmetsp:Transcript_30745/g.53829  ORF Transcript_30745/g.53829 Transcript_30745/m.53829 type:complete len:390 (-) Transcript_30745:3048-4217(-)
MSENLLNLAATGSLSLFKRIIRTLDVQECADRLQTEARSFMMKEKWRMLRRLFNNTLKTHLQLWKLQAKLKTAHANVHKLKVLAAKLLREKKANEGNSSRVPKIEIKSVKASLTDMSDLKPPARAESKIPMPRECSDKELKQPEKFRARTPMQEIKDQQRTPYKQPLQESREHNPKEIPGRTTRTHDQENQQPRGRDTTRRGRQQKEPGSRASSVPSKRDGSLFNKIRADLTEKAKAKNTVKEEDNVGTRLYNRAQEIESKREQLKRSYEPEFSFAPRLALNTEKWLNHRASKDFKATPSSDEVAVVSSVAIMSLSKLQSGCPPDITTPKANCFSLCSTAKGRPQIPRLIDDTQDSSKFSFLDLTSESCKESSRYTEQDQSVLDITFDV